MRNTYITLLTLVLLLSCNEQPIIIPDFVPIVTQRVVLVEELTGASCPNCPNGTAKVEALIEKYQGQVAVLAIHGTDGLSEPIAGKSKYDFRNPKGEELANFLRFWYGKPAAAINRTSYDPTEFAVSVPDLWDSFVEQELMKDHVMELEVTDMTLDPVTRELNVTIASTALRALEGDYKISVMVTESHIVDAQKDAGEIIDEFEFNHAMRMVLSETLGSTLTSDFEQNQRIEKSFSDVIPTDADHPEIWNTDNMELVAFVHRVDVDSDGIEHKEVIQALQVHLP